MMKLIVLDANFLLYIAKYKIDLFFELDRVCNFAYKLVLPQQVADELKKLSKKGKGKDKEAACLALEIARKACVRKVSARNADDALLVLASKNILATMDKELRKRFKKAGKGRILSIRQKKYLAFI